MFCLFYHVIDSILYCSNLFFSSELPVWRLRLSLFSCYAVTLLTKITSHIFSHVLCTQRKEIRWKWFKNLSASIRPSNFPPPCLIWARFSRVLNLIRTVHWEARFWHQQLNRLVTGQVKISASLSLLLLQHSVTLHLKSKATQAF